MVEVKGRVPARQRSAVPRELSVGEVAERSGLAVSAVHFYESKGLIFSRRSGGNQRRFPRETLRRVAVIKVAQRLGLPLARIADALAALPKERAPNAADWGALSARWRADLDERITRLQRLRDELDGCIGCGCLSTTACPLRNPMDELAREGPGPRYLERGRGPAR